MEVRKPGTLRKNLLTKTTLTQLHTLVKYSLSNFLVDRDRSKNIIFWLFFEEIHEAKTMKTVGGSGDSYASKNWRLARRRNEEESPDSHEAGAALWRLLTKASEFAHPYFSPLFWTGGHLMLEITRALLCCLSNCFKLKIHNIYTLDEIKFLMTWMVWAAYFLFLVNF